MQKRELVLFGIILAMFLASTYYYQFMPDRIPMHWNFKGEINEYSSREFGVFFIPILSGILFILFLAIPKIEVYKKNLEKFSNYFFGFKLVFFLFMTVLYIAIILNGLGYVFDVKYLLLSAFAFLFVYLGFMMKHVKRNYFIGIRTPWTLANEKVWDKTHLEASRVFYLMSFFTVISMFLGNFAFMFFIAILLLFMFYL